jgi:hypothetical protein
MDDTWLKSADLDSPQKSSRPGIVAKSAFTSIGDIGHTYHNVKRCKIVPVHHISLALWTRCYVFQLPYQRRDVDFEEMLLIFQGLIAKRMAEKLPLSSMTDSISAFHASRSAESIWTVKMFHILDERSCFVTISILPDLRLDERELIRCNSYDWTISLV